MTNDWLSFCRGPVSWCLAAKSLRLPGGYTYIAIGNDVYEVVGQHGSAVSDDTSYICLRDAVNNQRYDVDDWLFFGELSRAGSAWRFLTDIEVLAMSENWFRRGEET